ncbi:MAG: glycosyltransferase family 39 protein [Candidatus Neomarinimicrobiota bacterium]
MKSKLNNIKDGVKKFFISNQWIVQLFIFIGVISCAAYLRFVNLAENPGWYSDEGTMVDIANNLLEGRIQYFAINQSTLLVARMPIFPALLAGVFSIFEPGITTLRYVTASLGVITTGMLYWVVKDISRRERPYLGFNAAFLYAIYPQAILYSRLGFSYNLLSPLIVGILWFLWKYIDTGRKKWILYASLLVGIGSISDLMMFSLAPVVFIVAFVKDWRDAIITTGVMIMPFSLYSLAMLGVNKDAFIFDFKFTFFRLGEIPFIAQYPYMIFNYAKLIFNDWWWSLAVIGLFLISDERYRKLALITFFVPVAMLIRITDLSGLSLYYISPLFPMIALGVASLIVKGTPYVLEIIREGLIKITGIFRRLDCLQKLEDIWNPTIFILSSLILLFVVMSPIVITVFLGVHQTNTGISTDINSVMVNVLDAQLVIEFVNERVDENDIVLASPAIAWAINSKTADFQMAVAFEGGETKHFPTNIPADRFEFNPEYRNATYVIVDPIWINWAVLNMPEVANMVQAIEEWPKIYYSGEIALYENPEKANK